MVASAASETHRSLGERTLDMSGLNVLTVAVAWWLFLLLFQGEPYWLSSVQCLTWSDILIARCYCSQKLIIVEEV
jgi:hypothetical protein